MSFLEFMILLLTTVGIIGLLLPFQHYRNFYKGVVSLSILFLILHPLQDGLRWQMGLAYLVLVVVNGEMIRRLINKSSHPPKSKLIRIGLSTLGMLFLVLSLVIGHVVFPAFAMPSPTGPFGIGARDVFFKDEARPEIYTADPHDKRELVATIWYPIDKEHSYQVEKYPTEFGQVVKSLMGIPTLIFSHLTLIDTHTIRNAEISNQYPEYPILFFSHADKATRFQNLAQIEQLVSHGYVVVGMNHTYNAGLSRLEHGKEVPATVGLSFTDHAANAELVEVRARDIQFVLDELERLKEEKPAFFGKLNVAQVGVFGHSLGGSTAVKLLSIDERFKAGVNLDGAILKDTVLTPIDRPYLSILREGFFSYVPTEAELESMEASLEDFQEMYRLIEDNFRTVHGNLTQDGYDLSLKGAGHYSFTDGAFISPLLFGSGLDPHQAHQITSDYTLAFFNKYIKGEPASLLESQASTYNEVIMKKSNPSQ
ncbi:hypothetical protein [Ammoniphilus sp. CFH 90114]|uniref:alpha/beta hydrolase family protein n=1 Tax=Ammoniphilus sp. CFH 90114 TaxID=2493665 RepID=UPI00100E3781|nr:hypothetical protein [Ammoniphilus sp. CFH 90114]RXT07031.1 hypothetical protein EIZ39_12805 [Ammoniphilus sp. CFH 90114]